MPKVLIADELSPRAVEIFAERGCDVDFKPGLKPAELRAIVGNYDGLAIRSATKVTAEVLAEAKKLKVVGRAGIGVDNVDIKSATAHGVVVMNTPFGNAITTAEHAIALMFAVARQIPAANASTQAGKWEKNRFMGIELSFKTLGLIGCGNIGSIVAERAIGLKMRVIAYDPFLSRPARPGARRREGRRSTQLLARADFITVHTPLTEQTKNILSRANLMKTKKGVRIINCARGGLVDELAVRDLLVSRPHRRRGLRRVRRGAGQGQRRCSARPTSSARRISAPRRCEAQENVALQVAEQMADYLLTGAIVNSLNMPNVTAEEAPRLRALPRPRREAGLVRRPAHRHRHQGGVDRVRGRRGGAQRQAADPGGADGRAAPAARPR